MGPHERPLTTTKLGLLLALFKIKSRQTSSKLARTRGYRKGDFNEVFARHKAL
jgi:hypothetical protein